MIVATEAGSIHISSASPAGSLRRSSPIANDTDSDSDDSDYGHRSPCRKVEEELVVTVYPVVHKLEGIGRARAHAVMYANKTSPMTSAQATAAFNGIIRDYEPSQDIADHGETVGIQGTVWSSVVMSREPSGYVRSSYPTFPHPMPAGGCFSMTYSPLVGLCTRSRLAAPVPTAPHTGTPCCRF